MKKFFAVTLTLALVLAMVTKPAQAAAAACGEIEKGDTETSEVNLFFRNVQCTLERARPWVDEIEKEAKKLEETAKKFGEGVISKLTELMDKWIAGDNSTSSDAVATEDASANANVNAIEDAPVELNEVEDAAPGKCANGQVPDVEGKCQQVV